VNMVFEVPFLHRPHLPAACLTMPLRQATATYLMDGTGRLTIVARDRSIGLRPGHDCFIMNGKTYHASIRVND
jgi:non-homologous end joining protein Ku